MKYTQELHDRVRQNLRMFDYPRFDDGDIDALLDEIDRLTAEVEKHRWISVEERLPETYETDDVFGYRHSKVCNVIGKDRCRWMAYYDQDENQWCTLPTGVYLGIDYVTHWMPIPEPPKEDATC